MVAGESCRAISARAVSPRCRRSARIGGKTAQPFGGVADIGIGPKLTVGYEGSVVGVLYRHEPEGHRHRIALIHEIHIAGPAGRHDRLAELHRFRRHQTESFGPVQRQHDIDFRHQTRHVGRRQHEINESNIGCAFDRTLERFAGDRRRAVVDQLDDQGAVGSVAKGLAESGDGGQRILPRKCRTHVKGREHDQCVERQAKPCAHVWRCHGRRQRMWHHVNRQIGGGRDGLPGQLAGHPDFVQIGQAEAPRIRNPWELPGPIADDAAAAHARSAERPQRMRQERRVMMDDKRAARSGNDGTPRRALDLGLAESAADVECGGLHAGSFERVISKARAFANATHGREQSGNSDWKSASRPAVRQRSDQTADASQNLRPPIRW